MISKRVCVYVFANNDRSETDKRLKAAAEDYSARLSLSLGSADSFIVARAERGKPYFPNSPNIGASVSHSGEYFVCAVTDGDIGIDLQEDRTLVSETRDEAEARFRKMAKRFYHPDESEFVEKNTFYRFFRVWTAKESYVKYTGRGIDNDFSGFSVVPVCDFDKKSLDVGNPVVLKALGKEFYSARFKDNYTLCICTDGTPIVEFVYMNE